MTSPTSTSAAVYSRETAIEAITSFYSFLANNIPGLSPKDVKSAPSNGGWPELSADKDLLSPLNKTSNVLSLLRHLPILQPSCALTQIAPETSPINYASSSVKWSLKHSPPSIQGSLEPYGAGRIPAHVAVLTQGSRYGSWLLLDTKKGTVTNYIQFERPERDSPGPDEQDHWRAYRTLPVQEFFDEWREKFRSLEWVILPDDGDDGVRYRFDGETDEIRQIYREHGWPDNLRKDECRVALKEWYEKNRAE
ncbi:hypothetical protein V8F33_004116 [Rhypophila sp. PSN 637]